MLQCSTFVAHAFELISIFIIKYFNIFIFYVWLYVLLVLLRANCSAAALQPSITLSVATLCISACISHIKLLYLNIIVKHNASSLFLTDFNKIGQVRVGLAH